jgi:hypothetical protein
MLDPDPQHRWKLSKTHPKIFQAIVTDFNVHRVLVIRADFANAQYLGVNGTKVGGLSEKFMVNFVIKKY